MPRVPLESAVRRIRSLAAPHPAARDGLSDQELLSRFVETADESAFAALVARHGPAVLGVCRRVLADRHAAEDAFQATFLVLARRAAAIRKAASVGCWLHGVAFRVATRLKARLARQPRTGTVPEVPAAPADDVSWREVRRVLDEEVNRLPERLRLPVLLCYFEGKTRDEAAEALGWRLSTLRGRLEDGRLRLRARLARRGVDLSAALLAVSAAADGVAVEESLLASTVRAATGLAPAPIQALAKGVAMSAILGKGKLAAAALVLAIGLGTTLLAFRGQVGETPGQTPKSPEAPAKASARPPAPKADAPLDPAVRALALEADRVWVVPSPTREKPIPTPERVLKGPPADRPSVFELRLLPGDDPAKKWIVFLSADESGRAVPEVKPLPGPKWYVPYDAGTHDGIRAALLPAEWGEEKGGLQMGLRLRAAAAPPGPPAGPGDPEAPATPAARGRVTALGSSGDLAQVNIGSDSGVAVGATLVVYRGNEYVGDLRVRAVTPKASVGTFKPARRGATMQKDDGVVGILLWKPDVTAGHPVVVEVVIRNVGTKDWTLAQHRFNIYDYWPDTWFEVKAPDGSKWQLRKQVGEMDEADAPSPVTLKPGEAYVHAVRLDRWPAHTNWADSAEPVPNLFTRPGEYVVTARYRFAPRAGTWTADFASPPVRLTVTKNTESDWGEAAGGLRVRLRLAKAKFTAGEPLGFELDLKNTGDQTYEDGPIPMHCRIDLDGAEYQYTLPLSYPTSIQKIPPGKEFVPYVKVTTSDGWTRVFNDRSVPLVLTPGKHKVRVSYPVAGKVTPVSRPVEFEVADDRQAGKEVHGVRARLRPEKAKWKAGESPRLALEVANGGTRTWAGVPTDRECIIEVDGVWYENESGRAAQRREIEVEEVLKPGAGWGKWFDVYADRPRGGGGSWVLMLPDDPIRPAPDSQKVKLTPGKHKVRVAYFITETGADGRPLKEPTEIRVETNAVEIEIEK